MKRPDITPGEWDVQEGRTLLHIETANRGGGSPCGEAVCSVPKSKRANASAIAALPDLLAALEFNYKYHATMADKGNPVASQLVNATKSALVKAGYTF